MRVTILLLVATCILLCSGISVGSANCPPYSKVDELATTWSQPQDYGDEPAHTCSDGKCWDQIRFAQLVYVGSEDEEYVFIGNGVYAQIASGTCYPVGGGKTTCTHGMWVDENGMRNVTTPCP